MIINAQNFKFKKNLRKRIFATLLDYGLFFLSLLLYTIFFGEDNEEGGKTVSGMLALPVPVTWFIYFIVIEGIYGATLGHKAFDLKVLTLDRRKIRITHAFKRHLLDPLDILIYGIPAIIAINSSERSQRIGDMFANTIVVDTSDIEQYCVAKQSTNQNQPLTTGLS
ncbi:MAG: RDD family protein [Flavobacteriales bacterium]|nr:MAG: RDD family protein [Flavobacteriales bacterium]